MLPDKGDNQISVYYQDLQHKFLGFLRRQTIFDGINWALFLLEVIPLVWQTLGQFVISQNAEVLTQSNRPFRKEIECSINILVQTEWQ